MRTFSESLNNSGYAATNSLHERELLIKQLSLGYDDTTSPPIGPNTELVLFLDDVLASGATYMRTQEILVDDKGTYFFGGLECTLRRGGRTVCLKTRTTDSIRRLGTYFP